MYSTTLLETRRPRALRGSFGTGAVSFVLHTALIACAVYASLHSKAIENVGRLIVDVAMVQAQAPPPPPPDVPTFTRAPIAFNTLAIPTNIPTFIPPPSQAPFDASRFSGFGAEVASPWGRETAARPAVSTDAVYAAEALEERPERIGGPAPQYPDLLRNAGIGGHVRVEFIIDTLGRVEPGSVQILESTHELFSQAVRGVVPLWLFRPGRMGGQAVKARARMPVEFVRVQT